MSCNVTDLTVKWTLKLSNLQNGISFAADLLPPLTYIILLLPLSKLQICCRNRLARGLQLTHTYLGNLQLVSQYLTILGSLALALRDTVQAREILRSSLTLAKKLYDIPTQIWVLSVLTGTYLSYLRPSLRMQQIYHDFKCSLDAHFVEEYLDCHISVMPFFLIYCVHFWFELLMINLG